MKQTIYCEICKKETIYTRQTFAKHHLKKEHLLTSKNYYDQYIKTLNEEKCKHCNNNTTFINIIKGYQTFCSNKCSTLDKDIINKKTSTRLIREKEKYNGQIYLQTKQYINKSKQTKLEKYGDEKYCNVDKIKQTILTKYGGNDYVYQKTQEGCIKKYGVDNYWKTDSFRQLMEQKGKWIPLSNLSEYIRYHRLVKMETNKHKKELFQKWNGNDYYTGQKLMSNKEWINAYPTLHVSRNPLQPTIDHKISVVYGFKNKIDYSIIGSLDNLCVCARINNTKKNYKTENQIKGE